MRMMAIGVLIALASGCTASYRTSPIAAMNTQLVRGTPVLIATPSNGSYGDRLYRTSGQMTAQAVYAAFVPFSAAAKVSTECRDLACLERIRDTADDRYFVVPEILHWEDRATEWSGLPDRIEVKLTVFDSHETVIASTLITGKSKWATFGGDHPQDLLHKPIGRYVESLY